MSRIRYAGFAEESVYGTPKDAKFHVDIASSSLDVPTGSRIEYNGSLSRARKYSRPGFYSPSGNIEFAFDVNTITAILKWALGGYEFTAGTPNLHEIWGGSVSLLPSFTARIGKDVFEHVFAGCVINSLTIAVDNEYCMVTADVVSKNDTSAAIKTIDVLLLSDQYPLVFHEVTVSRAGDVAFAARVKKMELSISNNATPEAGKRLGEENPVLIPVNRREVNLSLDLYFEDQTEITNFRNATEQGITILFDGGSAGNIEITLPKVATAEIGTQPSGIDEITQSYKGQAYLSEVTLEDGITTVETEIYVQVNNTDVEVSP